MREGIGQNICVKKFNLLIFGFTVKPLNKGHIADRPFVSCREKQNEVLNFSAYETLFQECNQNNQRTNRQLWVR